MLNTVYSTNIYLVLRYYIGDEDGNSMASDSDLTKESTNLILFAQCPSLIPTLKLERAWHVNWKNWVAYFDMFLLASGVTNTKRQRAFLLYQAGARVREIFKQLLDIGEDKDYDVAKSLVGIEPAAPWFRCCVIALPQKPPNLIYSIYCTWP